MFFNKECSFKKEKKKKTSVGGLYGVKKTTEVGTGGGAIKSTFRNPHGVGNTLVYPSNLVCSDLSAWIQMEREVA